MSIDLKQLEHELNAIHHREREALLSAIGILERALERAEAGAPIKFSLDGSTPAPAIPSARRRGRGRPKKERAEKPEKVSGGGGNSKMKNRRGSGRESLLKVLADIAEPFSSPEVDTALLAAHPECKKFVENRNTCVSLIAFAERGWLERMLGERPVKYRRTANFPTQLEGMPRSPVQFRYGEFRSKIKTPDPEP